MKVVTGILLLFLLWFPSGELTQMKEIIKNNMAVKWMFEGGKVHFEMQAPTKGWVAIGFNEGEDLTGAYLLMGRIKNQKPEVVEHYTARPGSYQPILNYGVPSRTERVSGTENAEGTMLRFSIPIAAASRYHKNLHAGSQWTLVMAYSMDDDFQHHSIMRTNSKIVL